MCGMPIVRLTATVRVSPRAIRAAHDQFRLLSFTGGEHSVLQLPLSVSNQQIQFACLCDVNGVHDDNEGVVLSVDELGELKC